MKEIKDDEKAESIYKRCQCLPLLPAENIFGAYRELVKEMKYIQNPEKFRPFLTYMREQWMKKVND